MAMWASEAFFIEDFDMGLNDRSLEPLWDLVADLHVPVFWYISNQVRPHYESYLREIAELATWADNHPHIPALLTHGLEGIRWNPPTDPLRIPAELIDLLQRPNMHMEMFLLALTLVEPDGLSKESTSKVVLELVRELGVERLMWGSDMPCCERFLPYIRWVDQIREADFLTAGQREAILGANLERLLGSRD